MLTIRTQISPAVFVPLQGTLRTRQDAPVKIRVLHDCALDGGDDEI
jgi:hypothetical protein